MADINQQTDELARIMEQVNREMAYYGQITKTTADQKLDAEVQASNMSKVCKTEEEANFTVRVREQEQGERCHYEKQGDYYIVYRSRDRKVMKSINYFRPNLKQFLDKYHIY
jgi:hypothetical protein